MNPPTDRTWYRNAKGKLHAASQNWIRTGLGECGANIRRPGWTVTDDAAFRQCVTAAGREPEHNMCRHCLRAVRKTA